jgi:hypothetical protein
MFLQLGVVWVRVVVLEEANEYNDNLPSFLASSTAAVPLTPYPPPTHHFHLTLLLSSAVAVLFAPL